VWGCRSTAIRAGIGEDEMLLSGLLEALLTGRAMRLEQP
jgi:hypothetical protein